MIALRGTEFRAWESGLEQPHEKNGLVLLQNVASTPLNTHACFAAECGFGRLGRTGTLEALEQPHEKNGSVLLQNVAPTPLARTSTPGPIFRS